MGEGSLFAVSLSVQFVAIWGFLTYNYLKRAEWAYCALGNEEKLTALRKQFQGQCQCSN